MNLEEEPIEEEHSVPEPGQSFLEKQLFGLGRSARILLLIFASMFIWSAACYTCDVSRAAWPTTSGRIVQAKELPSPGRMPPGVQVDYEYTLGSQNYQAHTYFAPGPNQPGINSFSAGQQTSVYYNLFLPWMSTMAPNSQCGVYLVYMAIAALAVVFTFILRPDLNAGREIRARLPEFLDCLVALVESGVSVPAAIEQAGISCATRCPTLSKEVGTCVLRFKVNRVPLHQSLAQMGTTYRIDELNYLALSLAAAEKSGSSVAYQIRQQSEALRYRLKAEQLAEENASTNFGGRRCDANALPWEQSHRVGPMSSKEILEALDRERDAK